MEKQKTGRMTVPAVLMSLRHQTPMLMMANPNYFGNLQGKSLPKAIYPLQGSVYYESLGCLGLQPQFDVLKAVLYIYQNSGYSGSLCSAGSQEYVRFYLSYDDGVSWEDQGLTSLNVHDVPHEGRLEYAVEMPVKLKKRTCKTPNVVLARAILSWNVAPPANTPHYVPVWGNTVNAHILVKPRRVWFLEDVIDKTLLPELKSLVDLQLPIPIQPMSIDFKALEHSYQAFKVEPHRFAFPLMQATLQQPAALSTTQLAADGLFKQFSFDIAEVIAQIVKTDGNTSYEELNCIGLQPRATLDHLVGVLRVKKPQGYSGGLCTHGSQEFVRFYLDFGAGWQDMGLSSVQVHDINQLPKDGLNYAVFLPVDLSKHRKPCQKGPVYAKMRAILSWSSPPPANTPDFKPVWGNTENTTVMLAPGKVNDGTTPAPIITAVCGQSITDIHPVNGTLTNGAFSNAPFANSLWISGHIGNAPDASSGVAKLKYRMLVSADGLHFNPVANAFSISIEQLSSGSWSFPPAVAQTPATDGWLEYQEDLIAPVQTFVNLDILGVIHTAGDASLYRWVQIEVADPLSGVIYTSNVVKVRIDNTAPTATITMDQGACTDIHVGDTITGTYTASDDFFGGVSIGVLGGSGGSGIFTKTLTTSTSVGESGTWSLATTGMSTCGYVMQLTASDRALIGYASGTSYFTSVGHYFQPTALGFCLR